MRDQATSLTTGDAAGDSGGADATVDAWENDSGDASPQGQDGAADAGSPPFPAGGLCASSCPSGLVLCTGSFTQSGQCISPSDPSYGCGSPACAPCQLAHAIATCSASGCAIGRCEPGWADCNGNAADGCEASLESPSSCGSCSVQCSAPKNLCGPTGCTSACTPPLTACTDRCVNLTIDPQHCGSCTQTCSAGINQFAACSGAACGVTCPLGTSSDISNCGSCGKNCTTANNGEGFYVCTNSSCATVCPPGWALCGPSSSQSFDHCAVLETDLQDCGNCGHACASSEGCAAGTCVPLSSIWLATGVTTAPNLVLDGGYVYWTDANSTVSRVSVGGGSVQAIEQGQGKPWGLALEGGTVYWSNQSSGAIYRAPSDGSGAPQLVATASQPGDLVLYQSDVYWIDQSTNVWKVPEAGGTPSVAATTKNAPSNVRLIGSPRGPLVYYMYDLNSTGYGISLVGGWDFFFGSEKPSNADIAQDGVHVYYAYPPNLTGCGLESVDLMTGAGNGCVWGGRSLYPYGRCPPLAVSACGIVCGGALAQPERGNLAPLTPGEADRAVVNGNFVYFHSTTYHAIGKLSLP